MLQKTAAQSSGATVLGYEVNDPQRFGVVKFNYQVKAVSIEEKHLMPEGHLAAIGFYFNENQVVNIAKTVQPSKRSELELTCINQHYLAQGELCVQLMGRGFAWLDTGNNEALLQATQLVETIESHQGYKITFLEEIKLDQEWVTQEHILQTAETYGKGSYGRYLYSLVNSL